MLSTLGHKGNASQNHIKIHSCLNGYHQEHKQQMLAMMLGKKELSCAVRGNIKLCNHCGNSMETPQKLKIELPYNPVIPLPKECKSGWTWLLLINLFTCYTEHQWLLITNTGGLALF
jgi:hypothetical protein